MSETGNPFAELTAAREAFSAAYGDNPMIARFLAAVDGAIDHLTKPQPPPPPWVAASPALLSACVSAGASLRALAALLASAPAPRVGEALVLDEVVHQRAVVESIIRDKKTALIRQWRVVHRLDPHGRELGGVANTEIQFRARLAAGAWLSDGWAPAVITLLDLHATVTRIIPAAEVTP